MIKCRRALVLVAAVLAASATGPLGLGSHVAGAASVHETDFAWPASGSVSWNVATHVKQEQQRAVDIANARSDVVVAAAHDGTVVTASIGGNTQCHAKDKASNGYGNYVVIKHIGSGGTLYTLYAHLRPSLAVSKGDEVKLGTKLGIMGKTGCADGQHVHFAIGTCSKVSLGCTIWNAPNPASGTKVVRGSPTGGVYPQLAALTTTRPRVTTSQPQVWTPVNSWTFHGTKNDGSTADVTVGFSAPGKFSEIPGLPGLSTTILTQCGFDPQRDLAIPGLITLESTTRGFAGDFRFNLILVRNGSGDMTLLNATGTDTVVRAASMFNDGPGCMGFARGDFDASFNVTFFNVAPGQMRQQPLYVVIRGYFSPAFPSGNVTLINHLYFTPNRTNNAQGSQASDSNTLFIESASGPGFLFLKMLDPTQLWPNTWTFSPLGDAEDATAIADLYAPAS